jgi:hypothetical protein
MYCRTAFVALALTATATAACGIPRDARPAVIPGGVVNSALAAAEDNPMATGPASQQVVADLFLVQAAHLVKVARTTPRRDVFDALNLLLTGPTEAEFGAGIRTAISPQTTLRSARVDGNTAVVDLSGALVEVGGQEQILAVAQIVLTAMAVPGVEQVRLLLEGQRVEVPRADGNLTSEALRVADYDGLLEPSP